MFVLLVAFGITGSLGASPTGMCRNDSGDGFNKTTFLLNKQPLEGAGAICNDGSQAQLFYRPCCNGPTEGDFCNHTTALWFIQFGDGNEGGWCWDEHSCKRREALEPWLTSSRLLGEYFNRLGDTYGPRIGAFTRFGELNPNFYPAYAAYVPYCSSDLFLGECDDDDDRGQANSTAFCGKTIAKTAMRTLVAEMEKYEVVDVVIIGGAGIMTFVDELLAMLPSEANGNVVCDGCVLFDDLPSEVPEPDECKNAFSCTPGRTLPKAEAHWGTTITHGDCEGWRCLLSQGAQGNKSSSMSVIERVASERTLIAQHPLYDSKAFSARGTTAGADLVFAAKVRSHIEAGLAPAGKHGIAMGSACRGPQSSFSRENFFHTSAGGSGTYSRALYELLQFTDSKTYVDTCSGVGCNPTCMPVDI